MAYTVKAMGKLAGVSVRTLHHYDHVGLLKPSGVSAAGYRLYGEGDLARLQQILFFKELGFGLDEIRAILDRPGFDPLTALKTHRDLLLEKQERLHTLINAVDRTIDALERGQPMTEEMFEGFDKRQLEEWRQEARAKYDPAVVDASWQRASRYKKEDWEAIKGEMGAISIRMAELMDREPADPEVQATIGRWYRLINERFYDCTPPIFRGLGDLYVDDPRFTANYEPIKPGLAAFMRDAMHAYSDALEAGAGSS